MTPRYLLVLLAGCGAHGDSDEVLIPDTDPVGAQELGRDPYRRPIGRNEWLGAVLSDPAHFETDPQGFSLVRAVRNDGSAMLEEPFGWQKSTHLIMAQALCADDSTLYSVMTESMTLEDISFDTMVTRLIEVDRTTGAEIGVTELPTQVPFDCTAVGDWLFTEVSAVHLPTRTSAWTVPLTDTIVRSFSTDGNTTLRQLERIDPDTNRVARYDLVANDATTADVLWTSPAEFEPGEDWGVPYERLIDMTDDAFIAASVDFDRLIGLDKRSGAVLWTIEAMPDTDERGHDYFGPPVASEDGRFLSIVYQGRAPDFQRVGDSVIPTLVYFDRDQTILWRKDLPPEANVFFTIPAVSLDRREVYILGDSGLYVYGLDDGAERWTTGLNLGVWLMPSVSPRVSGDTVSGGSYLFMAPE